MLASFMAFLFDYIADSVSGAKAFKENTHYKLQRVLT